MKYISRWWPMFAWIVLVAFIMFTAGCLPKEIRDWNQGHPTCDESDCGKTPTLELPLIVGWRNGSITDADRTLFALLREISSQEIRIESERMNFEKFCLMTWHMPAGQFLLIRGIRMFRVWPYLKIHGWQKWPFFWRDHQIYRKPLGFSA